MSQQSAQLGVVLRWYDAITTWKFDVVEELFADDYEHTTVPASANEPPKNKAQGIEHAKYIGKLLGYPCLQVRLAFVN